MTSSLSETEFSEKTFENKKNIAFYTKKFMKYCVKYNEVGMNAKLFSKYMLTLGLYSIVFIVIQI